MEPSRLLAAYAYRPVRCSTSRTPFYIFYVTYDVSFQEFNTRILSSFSDKNETHPEDPLNAIFSNIFIGIFNHWATNICNAIPCPTIIMFSSFDDSNSLINGVNRSYNSEQLSASENAL
jgi:hypothetical protein